MERERVGGLVRDGERLRAELDAALQREGALVERVGELRCVSRTRSRQGFRTDQSMCVCVCVVVARP
jgi:hypothetical protein